MDIRFYEEYITPIKFHPYTSSVRQRIFSKTYRQHDEYREFKEFLIGEFLHREIHAYDDNKIVFECQMHNKKIFFGFYDGVFSIGFDYYDENER